MKNQKGFSLVEMLVSLIMAAILILTVGVISTIANSSFSRLNKEQQIYNDISYGFKLLQYKVRASSSIAAGNRSAPWVSGQHFLVDNGAFGLYQTSAATTDFVYDNGVQRETIFSVPQPGTVTLSCPVPVASQSVTVHLVGKKLVTVGSFGEMNYISFDMQTTALRRNQ